MLTTPRLVLTKPVPADLDDMVALWTDPAVYGPITGQPATREEAWHRLLRYVGHWQVAGYGHWTARRADDGGFVGSFGIMDSRRDTSPSFAGVPEVGWTLIGHAHGQGYAREALAALLAWADTRLPRTVCIIDPANAASLRLADRVGYRVYAEGTYKGRATLFLERSKPLPLGEGVGDTAS